MFEDREKIKKAVRRLIGLEIVEEDVHSIVINFLMELTTLSPEKIFRRIHVMTKGMCKDAITSIINGDEQLVKNVAERDEEVDRLYFLLVRLLRSAMLDPKLLSKFNLNLINCLDYRIAANLLETIGDTSVEVAKKGSPSLMLSFDKNFKKTLENMSELLEKVQDLAVKAFFSSSMADASQVVKHYGVLRTALKEYEAKIFDKPLLSVMATSEILASIDRICRCLVDIADLVVPVHTMVR